MSCFNYKSRNLFSSLLLLTINSVANLSFGSPVSTSEVHSTFYRKVTPEQRYLYFSKFDSNQNFPFKSYSDAIPISHYSYKIVHETKASHSRPQNQALPDNIDFRFPLSANTRIINPPANIVFKDVSKNSYVKLPMLSQHSGWTVPKNDKSNPPHVTSIIFPSWDTENLRPPKRTIYRRTTTPPTTTTSTTTTTTATPRPEPTTTELDLTDEFLDWLNNQS